ncbi:MAG: carbohydrate-binding protein [Ruminococcus sp.]|nr:carbohydrate-binding protein [Ruminococcus sp.]
MTKTTKKTRFAAIVLTLAMMLGMFSIMGVTTASAVTDKVSLYSSSVTFTKYGAATYEVFIQTRDNASNQQVYVHYLYMDSLGWSDAKAEYVTTLNDGSKIWKAYFSSFNTRYAIKLVADGREYWDNNNGKDYGAGTRIGSAAIAPQRNGSGFWYSNTYLVSAVLQNYAYHKNVFVRYTNDNWRTYQDQALNYKSTKDDGTEVWETVLALPSGNTFGDSFQYALCYQVNGNEYWANNFGANYDYTFYTHH